MGDSLYSVVCVEVKQDWRLVLAGVKEPSYGVKVFAWTGTFLGLTVRDVRFGVQKGTFLVCDWFHYNVVFRKQGRLQEKFFLRRASNRNRRWAG